MPQAPWPGAGMWAGPQHPGPMRAAGLMPRACFPKHLCLAALPWPQAWVCPFPSSCPVPSTGAVA